MPEPTPSRLPRLALVSVAAPPGRSGQARVLEHVLGRWPGEALTAFSSGLDHLPDYPPARRPWAYQRMPPVPLPPGPQRLGSLRYSWRLGAEVRALAGRLAAAWRAAGTQVVVACSGSPLDLPVAALACRRLGIPWVAYLFDDPVLQWAEPRTRRFAASRERRWASQAAAVVAPNEVLAEDFRERTGVEPVLVRNPVAGDAFGDGRAPAEEGPRRLVYTGSVYHAQADALRNVLEALATRAGAWVLDVYTSQPREQVEAYGLTGPHLRVHPHLDGDEVYRVQQGADAVLLPLGFETGIPEVIRSSAPGKTAEYLACGRPLLVHAPEDCWVAQLVTDHGAGAVVTEPSAASVAAGLAEVEDAVRAAGRVLRARSLADEFRVETARARLEDLLLGVTRAARAARRRSA